MSFLIHTHICIRHNCLIASLFLNLFLLLHQGLLRWWNFLVVTGQVIQWRWCYFIAVSLYPLSKSCTWPQPSFSILHCSTFSSFFTDKPIVIFIKDRHSLCWNSLLFRVFNLLCLANRVLFAASIFAIFWLQLNYRHPQTGLPPISVADGFFFWHGLYSRCLSSLFNGTGLPKGHSFKHR